MAIIMRTAQKYTFDTNKVNLDLYTRSSYYVGAKHWNDLPVNIQNSDSKKRFKNSMKNWL